MAESVQFNIAGLDSLLSKLESVKDDTKKRGGRSALRKAAMLVVNAAKQNAQQLDDAETGRAISDNIALRWDGKRNKRTGDLAFRIGVLTGNIKQAKPGNPDEGKGGPTPHAMLIELGTEKMRAQPYLRPALQNNINQVTDTFVIEFEKAIDRAIKRAAKKGK